MKYTIVDPLPFITLHLSVLYILISFSAIGVLCFDSRLGLLDQMVGNDSENVRLIQAVKGAFRGHHRALMLEKVYERVPNAPTMRRLFDDLDTIQR